MKNKKAKFKTEMWIYLFLAPITVVFLTFYLMPIVTVFFTSFTKWDGFNPPTVIGFRNYIRLFGQSSFQISLRNLAEWGLIAATLHVSFGVIVAFILYAKPFGGRFVKSVFMVPNVISMAAWALIYKFIFDDNFGFLNNFIRLFDKNFHVKWFYESPAAFWAVTFTWLFYSVIIMLVILNELMSIPTELHEAAKIDGASGWNIQTKINLPLCRNAIGVCVIMAVTSRIGMYATITLTTGGGPGDDTMNIPLILVNSINDMNYGYANASAVMMFLIGFVALIVINKAFRMNDPVY